MQFRLRTPERLEAWIEDSDGHRVRDLQAPRSYARGTSLDLVWDGFTGNGTVEPDGVYTPVVKLLRSHRTIALPSPIRLDTKPPVISVRHPVYPLLSPDGDGRRDSFTTHVPDRQAGARRSCRVRGRQVVLTKSRKPTGELRWNGKLNNKRVLPGRYLLTVAARDEAGNQSKPVPFGIAQVRYLVARPRPHRRTAGRQVRAARLDRLPDRWAGSCAAAPEPSAPARCTSARRSRAGVFRLYITAGNHSAKATVVVA